MKREKLEKMLDKSRKNRSVLTGYIGKDKAYYSFIVLDRSDELVLAARDEDFQIDGYLIFEINKIRKLIGYKTKKYSEIMHAEGVLDALTIPQLNLKSYEGLFKEFRKANRVISMDVENDEHGYYIGNVETVNDKRVIFSYFDAEGEWFKPVKLKFKDIDVIYFEDRYAEVFSKYVPDRRREKSKK